MIEAYGASGRAPNRVCLVRFKLNGARNAIELLPVVAALGAQDTGFRPGRDHRWRLYDNRRPS